MVDNESTQPFGGHGQQEPEELALPVVLQATGQNFSWISSSLSHVGRVRKLNEDACVELPEKRIWAVADGMGGHEAGDVASRMIAEHLTLVRPSTQFSSLVDNVEDSLLAAHDRLVQLGRTQHQIAGSTVVVMLAHHRHVFFFWAGDSRAYCCRNRVFRQITRDHSRVADLLDQGAITPDEAATHPEANVITRAVGASSELFLEAELWAVEHGDMFLLCSDGLYRDITAEEIAAVMQRHYSPAKVVRELVTLALSRGARDNVTAIVIKAMENV